MKSVTFAVASAFAFITFDSDAQLNLSRIELGANLNSFIYQGDLTPNKLGSFKTMRWGLDLNGSYLLNTRFALRTQILFGGLEGDESRYSKPSYRQQRNFAFKTPVTEISERLVWNITKPGTAGGRRLSPYITAGIGYAFLNIRRDYSRFNEAYFGPEHYVTTGLAEDISHSLPRGLLTIPVGAGLRYALTSYWSLNLETTYRLTGHDYLDGFSHSANTDRKDHFFNNSLGVIYTFGKSKGIDCPKF